jgi:hypothetical protein
LVFYQITVIEGAGIVQWYSAGLQAAWSGVRVPLGDGISLFTTTVPNGYQGLFPWGEKRERREADHSPPSSADVKEWVELYLHSPNTPPWCDQLKRRDNFTFTCHINWVWVSFPDTWII